MTRTTNNCQRRFKTWWREKECTKLFTMTKLRDSLSSLWFIGRTFYLSSIVLSELFYVRWLFLNTLFKNFYFVLRMEGVTVDQLDAVVEEIQFGKSSGKAYWNFFNQTTLLRSEVVFLVQNFVILLLITLCIVKLTILKPNCTETSIWISKLSNLVGYILPKPRLWLKFYLSRTACSWPSQDCRDLAKQN